MKKRASDEILIHCRGNGRSVQGSITLPSDEPEGGSYSISSCYCDQPRCGDGCHILSRHEIPENLEDGEYHY